VQILTDDDLSMGGVLGKPRALSVNVPSGMFWPTTLNWEDRYKQTFLDWLCIFHEIDIVWSRMPWISWNIQATNQLQDSRL